MAQNPNLVGPKEACEILGIDINRFWTERHKDGFPKPIARLAAGEVWRQSDIERYARKIASLRAA